MKNKKIPPEIQEWYKEAKPILDQYGLNQKRRGNLYMTMAILLGISLVFVLYYNGVSGAYKDNIGINITENIDVKTNTTNEYFFEPFTINRYANNFTIINNIEIQACGNLSG